MFVCVCVCVPNEDYLVSADTFLAVQFVFFYIVLTIRFKLCCVHVDDFILF